MVAIAHEGPKWRNLHMGAKIGLWKVDPAVIIVIVVVVESQCRGHHFKSKEERTRKSTSPSSSSCPPPRLGTRSAYASLTAGGDGQRVVALMDVSKEGK